jgi:hypothetical protein
LADDLEMHVSIVKAAGQPLCEVRNYIPSAKEYGRGVTFPLAAIGPVMSGLHDAREDGKKDGKK